MNDDLLEKWKRNLLFQVEDTEIHPLTAVRYAQRIDSLFKFAGSNKLDPYGLTEDDAQEFRRWLRDEKGYTPETTNNHLFAAKKFLDFVEKKTGKKNPVTGVWIRIPTYRRDEKADAKALTYDQVIQALKYLDKKARNKGIKHPSDKAAALAVAAGAGLRLQEILRMEREHVTIERSEKGLQKIELVVLPSKGKSYRRTLFIDRQLAKYFLRWYEFHPKVPKNADRLNAHMVNHHDPKRLFAFGASTLKNLCYSDLSKHFGMRYTAHGFRYQFVALAFAKGAPMSHVSVMFGHSEEQMTRHYLRIAKGELPEQAKQLLNI